MTTTDYPTGDQLTLERRDQAEGGHIAPGLMMTPSIGEGYWAYRVRLSPKQAILGFPKFTTVGIGFAVEEDWNTNLPYTCGTNEIFEHIAHNKGDDEIRDDDVRRAIDLVRAAARADRDAPPAAEPETDPVKGALRVLVMEGIEALAARGLIEEVVPGEYIITDKGMAYDGRFSDVIAEARQAKADGGAAR